MKFKNSKGEKTTITYDRSKLEEPTNNIYESIRVIASRAKQIEVNLKAELNEKLQEFATENEGLEEVFENREQIDVSKYYESLPKPHAMAIEEWENDQIYYRKTDGENPEEIKSEEIKVEKPKESEEDKGE